MREPVTSSKLTNLIVRNAGLPKLRSAIVCFPLPLSPLALPCDASGARRRQSVLYESGHGQHVQAVVY